MRKRSAASRQVLSLAFILIGSLLALASFTGCIVAGATSSGGFFIWPGSLALLVILIVVFALLRRR